MLWRYQSLVAKPLIGNSEGWSASVVLRWPPVRTRWWGVLLWVQGGEPPWLCVAAYCAIELCLSADWPATTLLRTHSTLHKDQLVATGASFSMEITAQGPYSTKTWPDWDTDRWDGMDMDGMGVKVVKNTAQAPWLVTGELLMICCQDTNTSWTGQHTQLDSNSDSNTSICNRRLYNLKLGDFVVAMWKWLNLWSWLYNWSPGSVVLYWKWFQFVDYTASTRTHCLQLMPVVSCDHRYCCHNNYWCGVQWPPHRDCCAELYNLYLFTPI